MASANPYVYAGDDPVNMVDPSGRDCVTDAVFTAFGDITAVVALFQYLVGLLNAGTASVGIIAAEAATLPSILEILGAASIAIGIVAAAYFTAEVIATCTGQSFPISLF